jgi:hypothetical protein
MHKGLDRNTFADVFFPAEELQPPLVEFGCNSSAKNLLLSVETGRALERLIHR